MKSKRFKEATGIFRRHGGILRMSQAIRAGISRRTLYAMRDAGVLEPLSRGVYRLSSLPGLSVPDFVIVSSRIPSGVVCLISALAFHELTTQVPHVVDIALLRGAEKPRISYPPIRVYWFSAATFCRGIETHQLDGVPVRVYNAEKTIADAFKYRNKIGIDVAVEALRTWRTRRSSNTEQLIAYAKICRVERIMRPYLEALT